MTDLLGGTKKKTSKWPWHKAFWDFPGTVTVTAFGIAVVLLCVIWCSCLNLDDATKLTLTVGISGGLLLVLNFASNYRRTVAFEEQLEIQRNALEHQREHDKERQHQELYVASIRDLSDPGSVYGLEQLAKESKVWAPKIATILCKYIRSTTADVGYQKEENHRYEPSVEVLTMMEVLTAPDNPFNSAQFDLRYAYLVGANLRGAKLKGANMFGINLAGAILEEADLREANLTCADLNIAKLGEAKLRCALLGGTRMIDTNLEGADLSFSKITGGKSDLDIRAMADTKVCQFEVCKIGWSVSRCRLNMGRVRRSEFNRGILRWWHILWC